MVAKRHETKEYIPGHYAGRATHLVRRSNEPKPHPYENGDEMEEQSEYLNGEDAPFINIACPVRGCGWLSTMLEREEAVEATLVHFQLAHPQHYGQEERW
jgi:hypothetical protein